MAALDFSLSLPSQFDMERDRRAAAHMTRDQLAVAVDMLIQRCYQQERISRELLKRVGHLEVELAAAECLGLPEPSAEHYQWAAELLRRR